VAVVASRYRADLGSVRAHATGAASGVSRT
jgi:hypothetical protein